MPSGVTIGVSAGAASVLTPAQTTNVVRPSQIPNTPAHEAELSRAAAQQVQGRRADEPSAIQREPPRVEAKYGLLKKKKKSSSNAPEEDREPVSDGLHPRVDKKA